MATGGQDLAKKLFHVAWMSIALGLLIEIALVVTSLVMSTYGGLPPVLADLANKISWSFFVCVGVAAGTAAAKSKPAVMGILGALAAPVALVVAKAAHKGASQALSLPPGPPAVPSALELGAIRAVEYAILGTVVGWMSKQAWATLRAHVGVGLALGVVFGAVVLWLSARGGAGTAALVSKGVNEVLFPLGCSVVLYIANALGKRVV